MKIVEWSDFKADPRQFTEPVQVRMWKAVRFTATPIGYVDPRDAQIAALQTTVATLRGGNGKAAASDPGFLAGLPAQDRKFFERKMGTAVEKPPRRGRR